MSSSKRKHEQADEARLLRAQQWEHIDTGDPLVSPPPGSVLADQSELRHNNTNSPLPRFYVDKVVRCRSCATVEVWPAARQKWWYEIAKGNINTQAVLCRACRRAEQDRKAIVRKAHQEGLARKRERGG
jgi:hypothetical protein